MVKDRRLGSIGLGGVASTEGIWKGFHSICPEHYSLRF